jgi:hypothetical protein
LSIDDIHLKYDLEDMVFKNSKVVNNRIVLDISKNDLKKFNISEKFYDQMVKDMNEFNNSIDSSTTDLSIIFEESRLRFYEMKEKQK